MSVDVCDDCRAVLVCGAVRTAVDKFLVRGVGVHRVAPTCFFEYE